MIGNTARARRPRGLLATGIAFAIVLSACGGSTVTSQPSGTAAAPTTTDVAFPTKSVTLVVFSSPGSGLDVSTRLLADILSGKTGHTWSVVNKSAGNGAEAAAYQQSQRGDGYTVGVWSATFAAKMAAQEFPYKVDDFAYVARLTSQAFHWFVREESPIKSMEQFVAEAKAKPKTLTVAGPGTGSSLHIGALKLAKAAAIEFVWVPFPGSADVTAAVLGGHTDAGYGAARTAGLRKLAQAAPKRSAFATDVPTLTELGYPVEDTSWRGVIVKAGVDPAVMQKLEALFTEAVAHEKFIELQKKNNEDIEVLRSKDFERSLRMEIEDTVKLRKELGL